MNKFKLKQSFISIGAQNKGPITGPSLALLTDIYQFTMAYGYWNLKMHQREAVFHLYFRKNPFGGEFSIAAGLQNVIEYLEAFRFSISDLDYLASLKTGKGTPLFESDFLKELGMLSFTGSLDAIPEGTLVFPEEPMVRIQAPLWQCQLLETSLLNYINFQTLIATKAARLRLVVGKDSLLEFGLRRAQGPDGGVSASRAAYIGGCDGTSNALAGKKYGIPVKGTHAHSWVMAFDDEQQAFDQYAQVMSDNCVLLVDTYDTIEGVKKAIRVGKELEKSGKQLLGIRLDSGDLVVLSQQARVLLDQAGLTEVQIVASNDLDEDSIASLKEQGAKISVWGVGTNLVTGKGESALNGVYKLSALQNEEGEWKYKMKISEGGTKSSLPGILQVRRYYKDGKCIEDRIFHLESEPSEDSKTPFQDLLVPIFREGKRMYRMPTLDKIKERCFEQLQTIEDENAQSYPVRIDEEVLHLKDQLTRQYNDF